MIVVSNTTAQTVEPGDTLVFNEVIMRRGNCECHRKGSGSVKLRSNGVYEIHFSANIDGATADAPAQLALNLGESPLLETTMTSSATGVNNVATTTALFNCCGDYDRVSVKNIGTVPVTISPNPSLVIHRSGC